MKLKNIRFSLLIPHLILGLLLISCRDNGIPESLSAGEEINEFLDIAMQPGIDPALRFAALEPVISGARAASEIDWLSSLLVQVINTNPSDPYAVYYLIAMAEGARDSGSNELALDYFRRLLKNYPDLELEGRSLHLIALRQIAVLSSNPYEVIAARNQMQIRFPERINFGRNQYYLAEKYRETGDWNRMFSAYEAFLRDEDADVPDSPDAKTNVEDIMRFHDSDKTWMMDNLDDLVSRIKYAIRTQNSELLGRYQSDNFFLMNWSQKTSDDFTHIPMNVGHFLNSGIKYRNTLENFSNENEAYLWTANWTWKIPTWYLYFRRIDYPMNPEINGQWEWLGIYIGERL